MKKLHHVKLWFCRWRYTTWAMWELSSRKCYVDAVDRHDHEPTRQTAMDVEYWERDHARACKKVHLWRERMRKAREENKHRVPRAVVLLVLLAACGMPAGDDTFDAMPDAIFIDARIEPDAPLPIEPWLTPRPDFNVPSENRWWFAYTGNGWAGLDPTLGRDATGAAHLRAAGCDGAALLGHAVWPSWPAELRFWISGTPWITIDILFDDLLIAHHHIDPEMEMVSICAPSYRRGQAGQLWFYLRWHDVCESPFTRVATIDDISIVRSETCD